MPPSKVPGINPTNNAKMVLRARSVLRLKTRTISIQDRLEKSLKIFIQMFMRKSMIKSKNNDSMAMLRIYERKKLQSLGL
jgi:hypothetical protein